MKDSTTETMVATVVVIPKNKIPKKEKPVEREINRVLIDAASLHLDQALRIHCLSKSSTKQLASRLRRMTGFKDLYEIDSRPKDNTVFVTRKHPVSTHN